MESRYRLYQFQTNVLIEQTTRSENGIRPRAGDWVIQWRSDGGNWINYDGPYAPGEHATAKKQLEAVQAIELMNV